MTTLILRSPSENSPRNVSNIASAKSREVTPNGNKGKKCVIANVSDEVMALLLSYLRAIDLAWLSRVDKSVFAPSRIKQAIRLIVEASPTLQLVSPLKKQQSLATTNSTPTSLFVLEVTNILAALSFPLPLTGEKGYWVSVNWMTQAKRYFESIDVTALSESFCAAEKSTPRKKAKSTPRKANKTTVEISKPDLCINGELLCCHGGLSMTKASASCKRKVIDRRAWLMLRRYFKQGPEFKSPQATECIICCEEHQEYKATIAEQREAEILFRRRDFLTQSLHDLCARKTGVPNHCTTHRWAAYTDALDELDDVGVTELGITLEALGLNANRPLIPGYYNLVPRLWLRTFRRFMKDPAVDVLPPLDCTQLLCHAHGLLVIPPHLEDYLVGLRRGLFNNITDYSGEMVEIVTVEEWDELNRVLRQPTDFHARFGIDGDHISWNVGVCASCDPYTYCRIVTNGRSSYRAEASQR